MKVKKRQLAIELVAWLIFIVFPTVVFSTIQPFIANGNINPPLIGIVILHLLLIGFYYFNYYYAIPRFYFTGKIRQYVMLMLACLLFLILVMQVDPNFNPLLSVHMKAGRFIFIFSIVVRFIMIFLLSMGISNYNRLKQTEQEHLKTELSYLKSQINPHFLFNTLNSIYSLSVKKSDAAPESITKLSSIMRYVITEAKNDFVPLDKELNYVSSYVELEKLRLTPKVNLNYKISGNTGGRQIAPLIFIPFIENAFKYGVSTSENSSINITIEINGDTLLLNCSNTILASRQKKEHTGLGIENSKKRLSLLYPGKHMLNISDGPAEFKVNLVLALND